MLCSESGALAQAEERVDASTSSTPGNAVTLSLFADAYLGFGSAKTGTIAPYHRAYTHQSPPDPISGFEGGSSNWFNLSFIGLDAKFDTGVVGATALIRLGPSVPLFYGTDEGPAGLDSMLGGFVTIRPTEALSIDMGYFGTIYGAEVAESWRNLNYTRGGLYFAMQPFYHLGAKGTYAFSDALAITAMVVNGANALVDDDTPAFGLQLSVSPTDTFSLAIGGYYDLNEDSPSGVETFADVVATLSVADLQLIGNFDLNVNRAGDTPGDETVMYWGVSLAAGYAITKAVGVAVRGEYLSDNDGAIWALADGSPNDGSVSVITSTATLDLKPYPYLIVRAEGRYEKSTDDIYFSGTKLADQWFAAVLGVVATTEP